jgi:hypothetical protein
MATKISRIDQQATGDHYLEDVGDEQQHVCCASVEVEALPAGAQFYCPKSNRYLRMSGTEPPDQVWTEGAGWQFYAPLSSREGLIELDHSGDANEKVGIKHDGDKPRFDLIPPRAEEMLARVLTFGAHKYAPGNWQHVPDAENRYIAAALRHINAQRIGEHSDPETGLPHLAHAMCCLAFVIELHEREFAEIEILAALDAEDNGTAPFKGDPQ